MNLNELAEKAFENWFDDTAEHGVELTPRQSFLAAFHLLSGIVEQQREALEEMEELGFDQVLYDPETGDCHSIAIKIDDALAATKLAIEEMGR